MIIEIREATACCSCGHIFCKKCFDSQGKHKLKKCMMGCSKNKFKGRRVTWFEINSIESLEFVCKEDNTYCKVQRFPFKEYIKHV